jgi:hypothetical protein
MSLEILFYFVPRSRKKAFLGTRMGAPWHFTLKFMANFKEFLQMRGELRPGGTPSLRIFEKNSENGSSERLTSLLASMVCVGLA